MNSIRFILLAVMAFAGTSLFAQEKTDTFKVHGNCGMCKKRIEKAAKLEGVTTAIWNVETKSMTVTYEVAKINNDELQKKIAAVGHDTEKYAAEDSVYSKLPGCCLYDRKKAGKKDDHSGHQH